MSIKQDITQSDGSQRTQSGLTLIELIIFIVIVSVSIVGVLKVLTLTNRTSVDPMLNKQAMAIADSLLTEIQQQPFTYCDPDDTNASSATSTASCTGTSQDNGGLNLGPTPNTESRYSNADPFDNVADYNGFTMPSANCANFCNPGGNGTGTVIPDSPSGYAATVSIDRVGGNALFPAIPLEAALKITVTVTGPANTTMSLIGYKVRYAPNI